MTAVLERFIGTLSLATARDLPTGYEGYFLTTLSALEAKRLACDIEDTHPLGRLFDLDVIGADGTPLSRQEVGHAARRCLLCDHEARYCMRNHTHTQDELQRHIGLMIERYVQ